MAQVLERRGQRAKHEREVRLLRSAAASEGRARSIREAWDAYLDEIGSDMNLTQLLEAKEEERLQKYENMLSAEYNVSAAEAQQLMQEAMLAHARKPAPRKINKSFK